MVGKFSRYQIKFVSFALILFSLVFTVPLTSVNSQPKVNSSTSVPKWDSHMTFENNTPFPLKFHIEAADDCTANASQSCDAGALKDWGCNIYICPGVYPFDDNGTLTESKCDLAGYEFFKYAEPEIVKALEEIAEALEEAEEDGDEEDMTELKSLNQTVGGVQADFAKGYYVLAWKEAVNGDSHVNATLDPSTGKFSLSD